MYKTPLTALAVASLICVFSASLQAAPLTVDGRLGDWGIDTGDHNSSDYSGIRTDIGLLASHLEDSNDDSNHYRVGPNYGGQNYDAEFLGVALQGTTLYLGISTGQRPDNGFSTFSAGDIRIETSNGTVFGIEVGGGAGDNGLFHGAIQQGAKGSHFALNSHGATIGHTELAGQQLAGTLWRDGDWYLDPIDDAHGRAPTQLEPETGTLLGLVDFFYTRDSFTDQHAIIEAALDVSRLGLMSMGDLDGLSVQWRPGCGNDELIANVSYRGLSTPFGSAPEPGVLGILGLGGLLLTVVRRRGDRVPR